MIKFVKIMEELGFPVAIKGSTMMTIGVATSYPLLLAALGWLVDTVTVGGKALNEPGND